jgi:hypothetical protein
VTTATTGNRLVIDNVMSQAKGCFDYDVAERWIGDLLGSNPDLHRAGDELILTGGGRELRAVEHYDVPPRPTSLVGYRWAITWLVDPRRGNVRHAGARLRLVVEPNGLLWIVTTDCILIAGKATITADWLSVTRLDRMNSACDDADPLAAPFFDLLGKPLAYRVEAGELALTAPDGSGVRLAVID